MSKAKDIRCLHCNGINTYLVRGTVEMVVVIDHTDEDIHSWDWDTAAIDGNTEYECISCHHKTLNPIEKGTDYEAYEQAVEEAEGEDW